MSRLDTFTQHPIQYDATTGTLTSPTSSLSADLDSVTQLSRGLSTLPFSLPPPPMPTNPQVGAAIEKLRTSGNAAFRKGAFPEAIRFYTVALEMAMRRPAWEPAPIMKEDMQVLYANRSQAHMSMSNWPEALADANIAVDLKKQGNAKAHFRRGRALKEMGRWEEARVGLESALEWGEDKDIEVLLKEVKEVCEKRAIDGL